MRTAAALPILATTVVGSWPQPAWLIDRAQLAKIVVPRIRVRELWRVPEPYLQEAQETATLAAIHDQERCGADILTDGEMRRESYSNRFATALEGVDIANPGTVTGRSGRPNLVPRIVGRIRRRHAVEVDDVRFLRANTARVVKITVPGPFTMTQQALDEHYHDEAALAMDYAEAVNAEIKDLFAAGADVVQIDEPYLQAAPAKAKAYGVAAINRALEGAGGPTALHLCMGYAAVVFGKPNRYAFLGELEACKADAISIETAQPRLDLAQLKDLPTKTVIAGVIDLADKAVETPAIVAARIRAILDYVPPARLMVAPDCGMKYLDRATAAAKLTAMVEGTRIVRTEIAGFPAIRS